MTELARLGADVTIADNGGETPVYAAARKGHTATVTELELAMTRREDRPSLLSLRSLPERQPAGPFEKRSFVNPSKV